MKLLIWYTDLFAYKTSRKGLETVEELTKEEKIEKCLVAFIQVEEKDEENLKSAETKMLKQIKWAAKKNNTERIVLHSFAHLSSSKASPESVQSLFNSAEERLKNSGYNVSQTPFGYFLDLEMKAPGFPLARLFKEF